MRQRRLQEDQVIELIDWWLDPLKQGLWVRSQLELKDMAQKSFGFKVDTRTIKSSLIKAFNEGLVEHRVLPTPAVEPERDEVLESKIRNRWDTLQDAIVVKSPHERHGGYGNTVHMQIGQALATSIGKAPMFFRHHDRIGLGSGRAVNALTDSLNKLPRKVHCRDITVMSLTGSLFTQSPSITPNLVLDADINASLFIRRFTEQVRVRMINSFISYDAKVIDTIRSRTWLDSDEFAKHSPTHAFLGVGLLKDPHRFHLAVNDEKKSNAIKPIKNLLKALISRVEKVCPPDVHPVADICSFLFFVRPPYGPTTKKSDEGFVLAKEDEKYIKDQIDEINARLMTINLDQLYKIENIALLAGTKSKAPAIKQILNNPNLHISILCTDSDVAEYILKK